VRTDMCADGKRRKRFLARGRINKRPLRRKHCYAKGAHRTALLIFIRFGRMLTAVGRGRVLLHLGAAASLDLRRRSLGGDRGKAKRTRNREADQEAQCRSHQQHHRASALPGQSCKKGAASLRPSSPENEEQETQIARELRFPSMINPNGDEFMEDDPMASSRQADADRISEQGPSRISQAATRVSSAAGDVWEQTKERAGTARERTEFFLRENPVPTVIGALALGVAIGLAIRYSSSSAEKEVEAKSPLGNVDLSILSLPFLWPFFKTMRRRYEDSTEVVKDGVDRLKKVDVNRYVKPLRKKWKAWAN